MAVSTDEPSVELVAISERCPMTAANARFVFEQLVGDVAKSHSCGRLHRRLAADCILLDKTLHVRFSDACGTNSKGFSEVVPPELEGSDSWNLPADISQAEAILRQHNRAVDPRRIDIVQLGAILCRMTTGRCASDYLKSPRTRAKVPSDFRSLIDGALGYDRQNRIGDCPTLQAQLAEIAKTPVASVRDDEPDSKHVVNQADTPSVRSSQPPGQETPVAWPSNVERSQLPLDFDRLGQYKIIARIGSGGMGDVYRAYEEALDRNVAVKVLPPELARHPDFVRRFRAEATAVAKLVHPNIVQIHAIGEDAGHHYFVMQLVEGESLATLLERKKRLSVDETLAFAEQCLNALAAAHQHQLIHRDVKPGNILIDGHSHRVLMVDFGLVKRIESGGAATATGTIMGTVDYIPPEQALGAPIDGRGDLYSIGVVMYQMLAGRLPFVAESPTSMAFQHAYEQAESLQNLVPEVPRRVSAIVTRLMAKNPDNRYQTAAEVLADIVGFRAGKPPARPPRGGSTSDVSPPASLPPLDSSNDFAGAADWSAPAEPPSDRGLLNRLASLFRRGARDLAGKLESTEQQVDGAIQQYQRRANELRRLVCDSEDLIAEFLAQVASYREASEEADRKAQTSDDAAAIAKLEAERAEYDGVAAEFDGKLHEQNEQCEQLHSQLAQASATLASLQSQRDILRARLQSAQAQIGMNMEASTVRIKPALVSLVILVALALMAFIGVWLFRQTAPTIVATAAVHSGPVEFPLGQWVDIQSLIDISRDILRGKWLRNGAELLSEGPRLSRVEFPITVDGSYDVKVEFTRPNGNDDVAVLLSLDSHPALVTLSGWNGAASGITRIGGVEALNPANPASIRPGTLVNGQRYRLLISARVFSSGRGSIDVFLDGKRYLPHWEGILSDLNVPHYWGVGFPRRLELGSGKSEVIFHSARLRMLSGTATVAPSRPTPELHGPTILSAHWGSGKKWADVTLKVRDSVEKGLPIWATTKSLKADPTKGWTKELRIVFEANGTKGQLTIPEGDKCPVSEYRRLGQDVLKPLRNTATK